MPSSNTIAPMLPSKKIAILGASGHIGKNLVLKLSESNWHDLFAFGRSPEKISFFLKQENISRKNIHCLHLDDFAKHHVDVIINAIGIGSPRQLINLARKESSSFKDSDIFTITNTFDDLVINYLRAHQETLYINLSSGAVYGKDFTHPVTQETKLNFDATAPTHEDFYGLTKLHTETKHSYMKMLKIVDLRLFNFFSRYIDLNAHFLVSDIISSIQKNTVFETPQNDLIRDFVHPDDLANLILLCVKHQKSGCYDVYSQKPISKFEMLEWFQLQFGLKYSIKNIKVETATGLKKNYFSKNHAAIAIGYEPRYTSLNTLKTEVEPILGNYKTRKN